MTSAALLRVPRIGRGQELALYFPSRTQSLIQRELNKGTCLRIDVTRASSSLQARIFRGIPSGHSGKPDTTTLNFLSFSLMSKGSLSFAAFVMGTWEAVLEGDRLAAEEVDGWQSFGRESTRREFILTNSLDS